MNGEESGKGVISEINVTPLVDVMLVLLVIFMVTAPMMMQGVKVDLPQTESKSVKAEQDPLILTITKEKSIFIENYKVELNALMEKLEKIFAQRVDKEIFLQADKEVPYGFVVEVMAQVKNAGITKLGMITEPLHK